MNMETALRWASARTDGVLITLRADGRPQSSDITYSLRDGTFTISVTNNRAKTSNIRRDDRVVLHLTDRSSWSYLSFDGRAELSPVTTEPDDATADALVEYYEQVTGEAHSNWDEYRAAMVSEGRLLITFTPGSVVGQVR